jgi:hypothetical protein
MPLVPIEGQPGLFRDSDTGQVVNIRDFRETDIYDTILVPPGEITFGTEFIFFQNIQQKRELDTNIKTTRKLSAGQSMVLDRIGLYFRLATGDIVTVPRDLKKISENGFYKLTINGILQEEGPCIKFPSGYGWYGNTTENDAGIVSLGVPATASAARLVKKQLLNQNHEIEGLIRFDQRQWLAALVPAPPDPNPLIPIIEEPCLVTNYLHGLVRAAVTK